jgi:hypothetical protein
MSTGNFEDWAGNISEIGAVYPFVGSETFLAIAGVVFWLWWHFKQAKMEEEQLREEIEKWGSKEAMLKIIDSEDPEHP